MNYLDRQCRQVDLDQLPKTVAPNCGRVPNQDVHGLEKCLRFGLRKKHEATTHGMNPRD
jgi:hypothetical protein